ncbi:hypothetical protein Q7A53_05330 [Halobacillus rhizosphaerae]|uniref:hypothetical protein n=1 Tax=Halobacillus rhizosphaerae TaxID=3064889 RepID=UPI00398AFB05
MEIKIKATLKHSDWYDLLYYDIKFKTEKSLFYKTCWSLDLVNTFGECYSNSVFQKRCVDVLKKLDSKEVEKLIIERVKEFLKISKKENYQESEYEKLIKEHKKITFTTKIEGE